MPYVKEAQLGFAIAALAPGSDPDAMVRKLEGIMNDYRDARRAARTVRVDEAPADRRSRAEPQFDRSLASDWADTIALDREPSIAYEQELIGRVTLADVNRVAKQYLDINHAVIGALTPSAGASQSAPPAPAGGRRARIRSANSRPITHLPDWGNALVHEVNRARDRASRRSRANFANGITLIVQPETISDSACSSTAT